MPELTKKSIFLQIVLYGFSMAVSVAGRFVSLALLWRSLTTQEEQQSYALLTIPLALISIAANFGLENGAIRFFHQDKRFLRFSMRMLIVGGLFFVAPITLAVGLWWQARYLSWAGYAACLFAFATALFQVAGAFFRSDLKVGLYTLLNFMRNAAIVAVVVLIFLLDYLSLSTWFISQAVVVAVIVIFMFGKIIANTNSQPPDEQQKKTYRSYVIPVFLGYFVLWFDTLWDKGFLNYFHPEGLPYFQLIEDYASFLMVFTLLISKAWPSIYFHLSKRGLTSGTIDKNLLIAQGACGIGLIIMYSLSPIALKLLKGTYLPGQYLTSVAIVLAVHLFGILLAIIRPILELKNDTKYMLVAFTVGIILNLIFNAMLVPPLGVPGAALAGLFSFGAIYWAVLLRVKEFKNRKQVLVNSAVMQVLFGGLAVAVTFALRLAMKI
ncbi:MAG: hypothetical protein GF350_09430 [Chitinivibrionales bacterium]|nr:hypothetical protein [Chitinivibrionales bacterium]